MTRALPLVLALCAVLACGCASQRERATAHRAAVRVADPATSYLESARFAFLRAERESPVEATATLTTFAALPRPANLPASEWAFVRVAVDRELALRALDAGRVPDAVTAIERALAEAEATMPRVAARDAGLLLVAEAVYRRAGRIEAADWAHREAAILVTRDAGP